MAAICEFYHLPPREVWDMDVEDYQALIRLMVKRAKEQEKG